MRFSLHENNNIEKLLISPLTGNKIECSIRAHCPNCGCLISHKSVSAVQKALTAYEQCKKCGCKEVAVRYVATEELFGKAENV